jgi:hypothetical protein
MKWSLLLLVACEKVGGDTYAIGWEGPKAGEVIEVISTITWKGDLPAQTFYEHATFEHSTVDGDLITSEKVRYLDVQQDGVSTPRASFDLVQNHGRIEFHGNIPDGQRALELDAARLTFADPAPRKRLTLHRFKIGEPYKLRADEADAMGLDTEDLTLVLRAAHDDVCVFDVAGTVKKAGEVWQLHGTLETHGPNYRYFHEVVEMRAGGAVIALDHLQKRP